MDVQMANQPAITGEMKHRYIERRRTDLEKLEEASATTDWATVKRIGHQVKGNAATFEFDDLGAIAIRIEESADQKDATALAAGISEFRAWLESQSYVH